MEENEYLKNYLQKIKTYKKTMTKTKENYIINELKDMKKMLEFEIEEHKLELCRFFHAIGKQKHIEL